MSKQLDYAELSHSLTRLLTESDRPTELFPKLLAFLGENLGWDFGALWRADYDHVVMRCATTWTRPGVALSQFESVTRGRTFEIGQGLPGTVWQTKKAEWVDALTEARNFPRISVARVEGLSSGVELPLLIGGRVMGSLEFFSRARRPLEPEQLDQMEAMGRQVALYVDRVRLEEALTSEDERFRRFSEASLDATITIDETSRILFVNEALQKLSGYTRAELEAGNLFMLIPTRLRTQHQHGIGRYAATGQRNLNWDDIVLPMLRKDGTEVMVRIRFAEYRRGQQRYFSGYMRPVDDRIE